MIMCEDEKEFELDALEVFRILKKWKNSWKQQPQIKQSIWIQLNLINYLFI